MNLTNNNTNPVIYAGWPAPLTIAALTTTRFGPGNSSQPFQQANYGLNTADDPEQVVNNRRALTRQLQLVGDPHWLTQVHGNNIVELTQSQPDCIPTADAAFTRQINCTCAILTADCLPIFLTDTHGSFVAALHCGWRGLHQKLIEKMIQTIHSPHPYLAWIGPGIGRNAYRVDQRFMADFLALNPRHEEAFYCQDSIIQADISRIAYQQLEAMGVSSIHRSTDCTYSNSDLYSYRRDGPNAGRMASLIWIKPS